MPKVLLVLDDDRLRLRGFTDVVPRLGVDWELRAWRDAYRMLAEIRGHLDEAMLISLDHDLLKDAPADPDPGCGRMIATFLAGRDPACPVIVHSRNTDAAWGMFNELSFRGWTVELVHHLDQPDWLEAIWLPVARRLTGTCRYVRP